MLSTSERPVAAYCADWSSVWATAKSRATAAAKIEDERLGGRANETARGLDCGFGWVEVYPARGPFIKFCKSAGVGKKHWNTGWWIPMGHDTHGIATQSVSVHYAAAKAIAEYLQEHGIDARACSRLD